jgi:hypothetical protein
MLIRFARVIALVVAATLLVSARQVPSADAMFEAARKLDVVDGDLRGAIRQYDAIVKIYGNDRGSRMAASLWAGPSSGNSIGYSRFGWMAVCRWSCPQS